MVISASCPGNVLIQLGSGVNNSIYTFIGALTACIVFYIFELRFYRKKIEDSMDDTKTLEFNPNVPSNKEINSIETININNDNKNTKSYELNNSNINTIQDNDVEIYNINKDVDIDDMKITKIDDDETLKNTEQINNNKMNFNQLDNQMTELKVTSIDEILEVKYYYIALPMALMVIIILILFEIFIPSENELNDLNLINNTNNIFT